MKIYPKKLHSIADLEREKEVLKYAQKQVDLDSLFSFSSLAGKSTSPTKEKEGINSTWSNLGIAKMIMDIALKYAMPKHLRKAEEKAAEKRGNPATNLLMSAAKEFIFGYIKWKAIELSYKGLSRLIKSRKKAGSTAK